MGKVCSASRTLLSLALAAGLLSQASRIRAADTLIWHKDTDRVEADISAWSLSRLLGTIASTTGWKIFLEPETKHVVSTKFKDRPPGEALRLLLGNLSFALVPQHEAPPKLFVFRTSMQEATEPVQPKPDAGQQPAATPIANELIVKVKPGTDIEALARQVGGKVTGKVPALNIYRLEFPDQATRDRARELLSQDEQVESIEYNYRVYRPPVVDPLALSHSSPWNLRPKAVSDSDRIVVGLIDTAIQPQGKDLDAFLLPSISVASGSMAGESTPTHATAMSETILRGLSVLNQEGESRVRILPVDVYGSQPKTTTFDVAYGIYSAINAGARIINLSLGTDGDTPFLRNLIQSAHEQGVIFFGAAGNEPLTSPNFPAAYPEVVAVTAGDRQGNIAPYANRGAFVDVVAPGSTFIDFNNQSYLVMGTSAATAYASGMAAGLAERTGRRLADIENEIRKTFAVKKP